MAKTLPYKNRRNNIVITVSLIVAIIITNSFIVFSSDEDIRSYFSNLTTTLTVTAPMVIAFVMVFRYKRGLRKQEDNKPQEHSQQHTLDNQTYDNNKMHLSICIFLILWFTAHVIWTFQYQQSSDVSIQDVLWFIGYGFFGYFLYSLYYHFFRKEFEPLVLVLIAIVIVIVLIFIIDVIVSTLRLLSNQPIDISILLVTVTYPTLDAIMIFPAVLILWAVRRVSSKRTDTTPEKNMEIKTEEGKSAFSNPDASSIWILLLSISMMLSAIGNSGFAYSSAYGPETAQRDVWIWDIFYNGFGLCLAAALLGYRHFFSFNKIDTLQH